MYLVSGFDLQICLSVSEKMGHEKGNLCDKVLMSVRLISNLGVVVLGSDHEIYSEGAVVDLLCKPRQPSWLENSTMLRVIRISTK